jgi:hypothetical protein
MIGEYDYNDFRNKTSYQKFIPGYVIDYMESFNAYIDPGSVSVVYEGNSDPIKENFIIELSGTRNSRKKARKRRKHKLQMKMKEKTQNTTHSVLHRWKNHTVSKALGIRTDK